MKIIVCLGIGFILGFSFMPIKYWLQKTKYKDLMHGDFTNSCKIKPKKELIPLVIEGNTNAYDLLRISCEGYRAEFLPYAFLMANKYHYKIAYYDVFDCYWSIYPETTRSLMLLDSLDSTTRNLALEYLKKGAELGEHNCQYRLGTYYYEGKYFEQDTILGQELKDKSRGKK